HAFAALAPLAAPRPVPPGPGPRNRLGFVGSDSLGIAGRFFRRGILLRRCGPRGGFLRTRRSLRQKLGLARLPVGDFAGMRAARGAAVAVALDPGAQLNGDAAGGAARPYQLERRELLPGLIALDDGAGNEIAGHGGGVVPMAA